MNPVCLAVGLGLASAAGATAATAPVLPVQLSVRDQGLIAGMVCMPVGAGAVHDLQAWTSRTATGEIDVQVRCHSHATNYSIPVARQTSCSGKRGSWRCERGHDVLRVTLPDESVVTVIPAQVPLKEAAEAVQEAAKLTIRPFYRPAVKVMRGQCTVSSTRTSSMKGAQSFAIQCGEARIILTRDCWDGGCRYFIPFAENY
jgi:hypothetical protein